MNVAPMEWANLLKKVDAREFDAVTLSWVSGPPVDFRQVWHSSQADKPKGSNRVGFRSPEADAIIEALEAEEAVEAVRASKSVILTLGQYSVNAELDFDGRVIAERALVGSDLPERLAALDDSEATREALLEFGEAVLNALGDEVDAIEGRVQERVPGVKSVDLEAD